MGRADPLGCCRLPAVPIITLIVITLAAFTFQSPAVLAAPGEILASFAAPGESPGDLAWDGAHLWLLDDQTATLYMLDPQTGAVLRQMTLDLERPCGLASDGTDLWVSDCSRRTLLRLDASGAPTDRAIPAPGTSEGPAAGRLAGLAWDGTDLWIGTIAGWSSRIEQCDPLTGEVLRSYFSIGYPIAVETDGQRLWSATFSAAGDPGRIFQYDFASGTYVSHFDAPGRRPAGLAWDGTALWCVDSDLREIFQLALD